MTFHTLAAAHQTLYRCPDYSRSATEEAYYAQAEAVMPMTAARHLLARWHQVWAALRAEPAARARLHPAQ